MKIISKELLADKIMAERITQEQAVLESVRHPFLIGLHHAFETENQIFFLMELLRGGALFDVLRNEGRFSENRSKFYCA